MAIPALVQASGLVLRRPVIRSPFFHWPRFLRISTRSKRLSTLRFPPRVDAARRLRCCDIGQNLLFTATDMERARKIAEAEADAMAKFSHERGPITAKNRQILKLPPGFEGAAGAAEAAAIKVLRIVLSSSSLSTGF